MRKFFLFCLLISCFLFAGFVKDDLSSLQSSGKENFNLTSYYNEQKNHAVVYGQTISTNASEFNLNAFLQSVRANVVSCSNASGEQIYYAYTNNLSHYVYVEGKRVNLQIACSDELVYIGYPLIMGSF